tara:strand:- start:350 stop:547 length:198 start_codon:yes stop_codon:yes gene_type:complete
LKFNERKDLAFKLCLDGSISLLVLLYTWFVMRCQAFEVSLKKPCCVQGFFMYQAIFAKSAKSFVV